MKVNINKAYKDSKILVVGGTGFLGRNLIKRLSSETGHIYSFQKTDIQEEPKSKNVTYLKVNLSDSKKLNKLMKNIMPDYVFNVSGYIDHSKFFKGGFEVISNQYIDSLNLISALNGLDIKSYIHTGSSDEYGRQQSPQRETDRESPATPYSAAKASMTHTLQAIHKSDNFPSIVLKLYIVYGPYQQSGRLIPDVITRLLSNEEINVSSGDQKRDFCFVSDIVEAYLLAATSRDALGKVFNLGLGKSLKVREIVEKIEASIGRGHVKYGAKKIRKNESLDLYPDISHAKKVLEWEPLIDIDQGLGLTIDYYKNLSK